VSIFILFSFAGRLVHGAEGLAQPDYSSAQGESSLYLKIGMQGPARSPVFGKNQPSVEPPILNSACREPML
jgi:hypothetical protein